MKLSLYSIDNRYVFTIGRFSSLHHFPLCPDIKPSYQYAWEAYRDAKRVFKTQSVLLEVLHKTAADDLAVTDIAYEPTQPSAEQMIIGHYAEMFDTISDKYTSFKDDKDKKIAYEEIKGVVSGMLKIQDKLENDEDKAKVDKVIDSFRKLVKKRFPELLAKDKAEMEEQKKKEAAPPEIDADPPMTEPLGTDSVDPTDPTDPTIQASQIDTIIRYASSVINDIRTEMLDEYSERICRYVAKHHPDSICNIDYENGVFRISKAGGSPLLRISINENLQLQDIEPEGELAVSLPLYSLEFYQKYWKPIVENVGHYMVRDLNMMFCPAKSSLPDIPNKFPQSIQLTAWDTKSSGERPFEIYFGGETPSWTIKKVDIVKSAGNKVKPSKYTEEDFINGQPKRVQCIDANLPSINGKIGEVLQVIPLHDHVELDINFGRLVVRLTENQIEIIDEVQTTK